MIEMLYRAQTSLEQREALFRQIQRTIGECHRCNLAEKRDQTVCGEGPLDAKLMFVGEGPGADEDLQGRPFVGRAGQLLTKILESAGIKREEVYITNIVKCRPPDNRVPQIEEVLRCQQYLEAQIAIIGPKIIVALGNTPTKWFLHSNGITRLRGRWFTWRGIDLMPMFHPSYLLRNDSRAKGSPKDLTWQDIQAVKIRYDQIAGKEEQ